MIVRAMNVSFCNEARGMDFKAEFYCKDVEIAGHSAADFYLQIMRIHDEAVEDSHQQVLRMLINDVKCSSYDAFVHLVKYLIEYIAAKFNYDDIEA